ncbi:hypothetical protein EMIT0P74_10256 [Pseudomonas sp. IT-P74]
MELRRKPQVYFESIAKTLVERPGFFVSEIQVFLLSPFSRRTFLHAPLHEWPIGADDAVVQRPPLTSRYRDSRLLLLCCVE